jgi:hypothetical protein
MVDGAGSSQGAAAQAPEPTGSPAQAQPAPAPTAVASAPEPAREPAPEWSSPADAGWRAAQALKNPAQAGQTQAGLPRRTPKANLVPGRAGGTGAARAVPPPQFRQDPPSGGQ